MTQCQNLKAGNLINHRNSGFVCISVTLVPHRVGEFGQVWQQFSLQAHWRQTEVPEQGLCSLAVLPVLRGTTRERELLHLKSTATGHMLELDELNNNTVQLFR